MKRNLLKILAITSIFLSPLTGNDPCPPSNDPCCPPPDPCAKCAQIWPTRGPDWIITPSAGPCVNRGWDAHITVDFLYWSIRENQLGFAITEHIQTLPDAQVTVTSKGTTIHPDWNFEPGYRIGVGILKDHDGWDISAKYTWISVDGTKKRVSIDDTNTERIRPIGGLASDPGIEQITQASGLWKLDFSVIDAELGRNFFISRYLVLRPFVGFKGTWQDQTYHVKLIGMVPEFGLADNSAQGISNQTLSYWGVGIRAGLNTSWHFNRCWSLFGEMAFTGLWEEFCAETKATRALLTPQVGSSPVNTLYTESEFSTIKPVVELLIGLRYESWFCCETYHMSLDGGWELQWWGDQNQFFETARESRLGDLVLNGLTLRFRLDF